MLHVCTAASDNQKYAGFFSYHVAQRELRCRLQFAVLNQTTESLHVLLASHVVCYASLNELTANCLTLWMLVYSVWTRLLQGWISEEKCLHSSTKSLSHGGVKFDMWQL